MHTTEKNDTKAHLVQTKKIPFKVGPKKHGVKEHGFEYSAGAGGNDYILNGEKILGCICAPSVSMSAASQLYGGSRLRSEPGGQQPGTVTPRTPGTSNTDTSSMVTRCYAVSHFVVVSHAV